MITTTVKNAAEKSKSVYPYIGKSRETGRVALFHKAGSATILVNGRLGTYDTIGSLSHSLHESNFDPYYGEVIISNDA